MLTSPVNVTIATSNGMSLKPHVAPTDAGNGKEPAPAPVGPLAAQTIEPELPSNSLLTHVNAVAATAGNRTVLQELTLSIASMFKLVRRPGENMTALFLKIIATIEAMPQAERLQFEVRSGLKAQKITLADLAMALRKPDGPEAARLTAMAEAPATVPGRAAVTAATSTYLQEGTANGHAEETLAMRAAARNSAAGQNVFTAEIRVRHADTQPTDAKVLQTQLKSMFEPGEAKHATVQESADVIEPASAEVAEAGAEVETSAHEAAADESPMQTAEERPLAGRSAEQVVISTANLRLDPQSLEKIRSMAQAIADQAPAVSEAAEHERAAETDAGDQRPQTMLTLKGLMEVVTAIPAKAAEMLMASLVEIEPPLPETASESSAPTTQATSRSYDEEQLPELAGSSEEHASEVAGDILVGGEKPADAEVDEITTSAKPQKLQSSAAPVDDRAPAAEDRTPLTRPDLTQHAVPFAYAQVQPAREEVIEAVTEDESKDDADEDADNEQDEGEEKRRPRDEYDAIHDPVPEEEPVIVINRDSTEADRAFALYQRMGGF